MILKTENKEITLKLKIKDIIKLTKEYKGENLHKVFFKALLNGDLDFLSSLIQTFSYIEEEKAFNTSSEACEFLDLYINETKKSIAEIYEDFAKEINESGFFMKKMTEQELKAEMVGALDIDMEKIMHDMVEQTFQEKMQPVIEKEFKGFKA